jgi:general secretion pathway protein B
MSLILEALRKSEAERRRGQAPDLRTELPPVAPPRARALPRWGWLALAVAILALAWLLLARPGAMRPDEPFPTPADTQAPGIPQDMAGGSATPGPIEPARPTIPIARDAAPVPPAAPVLIAPDAGIRARENPGAPGQRAPSAASAAKAADIAGEPAASSATADGALVDSTPPASPPPPAPSQPTQATAPTAPTTPDERPLALSDLSPDERRQLPPLKLSMHMWSEDPARRFVILDGQRLAEGDRAGPAVVDAIRSDDVLLAWNGMRLRLSLR